MACDEVMLLVLVLFSVSLVGKSHAQASGIAPGFNGCMLHVLQTNVMLLLPEVCRLLQCTATNERDDHTTNK